MQNTQRPSPCFVQFAILKKIEKKLQKTVDKALFVCYSCLAVERESKPQLHDKRGKQNEKEHRQNVRSRLSLGRFQ